MNTKLVASFKKQKFMSVLGAKFGNLGEGHCEIILPFNKKLTQQHGLIHGGVIATIADNAAGFAAFSLMEDQYQPLTIEFKINFLSQSPGKVMISQANVLRAGRSIFHTRADVFNVCENQKSLIATSLVTVKASKRVFLLSDTK